MIIHVPDQHPGRCLNTRPDPNDAYRNLRCLGNEGHEGSCYFERTTPVTVTPGWGRLNEYVPPKPKPWVAPPRPTTDPDVVGNCATCGLQLRRSMGYVCSQFGCPTGLGPVWS